MLILTMITGSLLLAAGRKLFWLFIGAIGFIAAMQMVQGYTGINSEWTVLAISLIAGLVGALLAIFIQNLAIGLGGFLAGGYLTTLLLTMLDIEGASFSWIGFLVGGILGVILLRTLFEWALILLTSGTGAWMIVNALELRSVLSFALFAALLIVGITIQAIWKRGEKKKGKHHVRDEETEEE